MRRNRMTAGLTALIAAGALASCADQPVEPDSTLVAVSEDAQFGVRGAKTKTGANSGCTGCAEDGSYSDELDAINAALEAEGSDIRVFMAELMTAGRDETPGMTVFARDVGNKQLGADFVPNDPRRGSRSNITYLVDGFDGATSSGPSAADTEGAIDSAMATWDSQTCSDLDMTKSPTAPIDIGLVQFLLGFGGLPNAPLADIVHGGWLPPAFFDALAPGGGSFIVGGTLTFTFGTDIDNDGKDDVAFREIYYNDGFPWGIDVPGLWPIDVETVVLHESGHGLSQGHFGKMFGTFANLKLHFAPAAVMNAVVFGPRQTLLGSDAGGHCSNWAQWPNN